MPLKLTPAAIERQVKTKTNQVSDDVIREAVSAILTRPRKIDRTYDIPYVAGYSKDGRTVFIDRHLPLEMNIGRVRQRIIPYLWFMKWSRSRSSTRCDCTTSMLTRSRCEPSRQPFVLLVLAGARTIVS